MKDLQENFVNMLNSKESKYRSITVCCHYRYGPPVRTPHRVVVENLSSRVSWQVIATLLQSVVKTIGLQLTNISISRAVCATDVRFIDVHDNVVLTVMWLILVDDICS